MKALKVMLWLQLLAACIAMIYAWGVIFQGASGAEWCSDRMTELEHVRQSPNHSESVGVRGLSESDLLGRLRSAALNSAHQGGGCLAFSLGLAVFSGVEL